MDRPRLLSEQDEVHPAAAAAMIGGVAINQLTLYSVLEGWPVSPETAQYIRDSGLMHLGAFGGIVMVTVGGVANEVRNALNRARARKTPPPLPPPRC